MARKQEILKDATIYAASSYAAQFLDMINGVLMRRFLGPTNMGIWSFLQVIQSYAKHAGLGLTTATSRDVPYYLSKGETAKAEQIKNLVYSFTVVTAAIFSLGVIGFALYNRRKYSPQIFYGLFVIAALALLQRIYNLFVVLLRAYKKFIFAGFLNIASSATTLSLTVLLIWKFKLYGLYIASVLQYILIIFFILRKTPYRFSLAYDKDAIKPLLSLGSAMVISGMLRTVLMSADEISIVKFLGFKQLGYYSIALMVGNYLYALPNMLGIIFFPHFQEIFAKNNDHRDLEKYLSLPTLSIAYVFPFLLGLAWIGSVWFIPATLPKYLEGIPAMKIAILGSFFMALTHPFGNYIITVRKHWLLIPLQGLAVAGAFGISWYLIHLGWGIKGVAIAMAVVFGGHYLTLSWASMASFEKSRDFWILQLKVFAAFLSLAVALKLTDFIFRGFPPSLFKAIVQFLVFAMLMSPLIFQAEKEAGIATTIRKAVIDLIQKLKSVKFSKVSF